MGLLSEPDYESREFTELSLRRYLSSHDLLQEFVDMVVRKTNSQVGFLHFYDEARNELDLKVWSGAALAHGPVTHNTRHQAAPSEIWTKSILNRAPDVENQSKQTCMVSRTKMTDFKVKNYISFPIFLDDKIVAVLGIGNRSTPYDATDLDKLEVYVKVGWPIIVDLLKSKDEEEHCHSIEFQNRSHEEILVSMTQAIGKALELRDEYTSHHQSNVAKISAGIARQLGLSKERCFGLNIGSLIHDIGKIVTPSQILNKTGKLLAAELEMVRLHAEFGREIFSHLDLPWPIADMIGQHHERMDGSGYPNGLKGCDICLEARIIAVADTYDAMSGDRPYRHAPGQDKALSTLINGRITKYDPYVVDAFIEVLEDNADIQQLYA
tara:strand:+ start:540 stop:1682 length:1143 start_codon:yes stop_codon:yes gene_type:complete